MVDLPPVVSFDPLQAVVADPKVPDRRRLCPALIYRQPNGEVLNQQEARAHGISPDALVECSAKLAYESGYCPICGQEYTFEPSLKPGDVVDRKYEVKGPVAFGGLGWIYLAWARHLARWVIIKGLLNIKDSTQRERLDPRNGLAACPAHDVAFDTGMITVNGGLRIHLAASLADAVQADPLARQFYGQPPLRPALLLPASGHPPARKYLDWHRENIFGH